MTKGTVCLANTLLILSFQCLGGGGSANAGTDVTVNFHGANNCVTGNFNYDQSQSPTSAGVFGFSGNVEKYGICSQTSVAPTDMECVNQSQNRQYQIKTWTDPAGKRKFTLSVKYNWVRGGVTSADEIIITITTLDNLNPNTLPFCDAFSNGSNKAVGTYTKIINGTTVVSSCAITVSACTPAVGAAAPGAPHPTGQIPPSFWPGPQTLSDGSVMAYELPTPGPLPLDYACQPRPACCLTRLFGRGSLRLGCR